MNDVVIRAERLGKRYLVGHRSAERERYTALRDVVGRTLKGFGRSALDVMRGRQVVDADEVEDFWALKDVSFEIKRGEVVGVIGRNGAGKSTLLKILSRITEPSEGRVEIKGRVASLLEVGTGFHPELTGRENIYLNGAILGMSRAEIRKKFDEIVDFAGVEKFLDTPVKRYSSGMYVRLAFAVAAHLEQEVLVVDEVLAVGDAEFQRKCLGKMKDMAGFGRTVLFVSHNIGAVQALCGRGLVLRGGQILSDGGIDESIGVYLGDRVNSAKIEAPRIPTELQLADASCRYLPRTSGFAASIHVELKILAAATQVASVAVRIKDHFGAPVAMASLGGLNPSETIKFEPGLNSLSLSLDANPLASGTYMLSVDIAEPWVRFFHRAEDCMMLEIGSLGVDDDSVAMRQSWGYGSLQLPLSLRPH